MRGKKEEEKEEKRYKPQLQNIMAYPLLAIKRQYTGMMTTYCDERFCRAYAWP